MMWSLLSRICPWLHLSAAGLRILHRQQRNLVGVVSVDVYEIALANYVYLCMLSILRLIPATDQGVAWE